MKLKMFAIYDNAAKAFLAPFVVATTEMCLRQFVKQLQGDPDHDFVRFGDQYVLYELAEWDNESGEIFDHGQVSLGSLQVLRNRVRVIEPPSAEYVAARNPSMGSED